MRMFQRSRADLSAVFLFDGDPAGRCHNFHELPR